MEEGGLWGEEGRGVCGYGRRGFMGVSMVCGESVRDEFEGNRLLAGCITQLLISHSPSYD